MATDVKIVAASPNLVYAVETAAPKPVVASPAAAVAGGSLENDESLLAPAAAARTNIVPFEVDHAVDCVDFATILKMAENMRPGKQPAHGRSTRWGAAIASAEEREAKWQQLQQEAAATRRHLTPWHLQQYFAVDFVRLNIASQRDEIRKLNEWDDMKAIRTKADGTVVGVGDLVGCIGAPGGHDFLCQWGGPLLIGRQLKYHSVPLKFETHPGTRLSHLLESPDRKQASPFQLSGYSLDTLRAKFGPSFPEIAHGWGVHALLDRALVMNASIKGVDFPIELALTSQVIVAPNANISDARLADREIRGSEKHVRIYSSPDGKGTTHRVLLRPNEVVGILPLEDRILAATHHDLFDDPWTSRALLINFPLIERILNEDEDGPGGDLFALETPWEDDQQLVPGDQPLLLIIVSHLRLLLAGFNEWKQARLLGNDDAIEQKKLSALRFTTVAEAVDKKVTIRFNVVRKQLRELVYHLKARVHQTDTLLDLSSINLVARIPSGLTDAVHKQIRSKAVETTLIEANPFVSISVEVLLDFAMLEASVAKTLPTPVVLGPDIATSALRYRDVSVRELKSSIFTDYFATGELKRKIEANAKQVEKAENRLTAAAAAGGTPAGVLADMDESDWQARVLQEYRMDIKGGADAGEVLKRAKDRADNAPRLTIEKSVRDSHVAQLAMDRWRISANEKPDVFDFKS